MLAVNDRILNLNDKSDPYVKRVLSAVAKLKELTNNHIRLEYTNQHITVNLEDKRKRELAQTVGVPFSETVFINGIDERWTYFKDRKVINNDFKYVPRRHQFNGDLSFDQPNSDIGLLFFLVFISPHCEGIDHLKDEFAQNDKPVMKHFRLPMPTFEALKKSEIRKKEGEVSTAIYRNLKLDTLKKVSLAMGVINIDQLTDPQLRNTLYDISTVNEESMDKFFSKLNNSQDEATPAAEEEGDIQLAIDQKIIGLNKKFGRPVWKFKGLDGKFTDDVICEVVPGENEREKLINFLKENPDILAVIKSKIKV
jgi:hypothetical protein